MMTRKYIIVLVAGLMSVGYLMAENNDSTISRSVTVEREFQPIIQNAGKLGVAPQRLETKLQEINIEYSERSFPVQTTFNVNPLQSSTTHFTHPEPMCGYLEGALGYINSYLDFRYRLQPKKSIDINLFAYHDADWGTKTWSDSYVGMNFNKQFSDLNVFFAVRGGHNYFTRYGRYFAKDDSLHIAGYKDLTHPGDKQHIWDVDASVGVRSAKGTPFQYLVQTGYFAYILPNAVAEHQIRTHANVAWEGSDHHAGLNLYVQNAFLTLDSLRQDYEDTILSRHAMRIEPYYEYKDHNVSVHAGVNLDVNIGRGSMMSNSDNISFAPSPNVSVEYRVVPELLALYGGAEGKFGFGTLQEFMQSNPYRPMTNGVISRHVCSYTPVDAFLGLKIRPIDCFLIDVYARYAYLKNQCVLYGQLHDFSHSSSIPNFYSTLDLDYFYSDWQRWTVGAEFTYHYQDIIRIKLAGHYYKWIQQSIENIPSYLSMYDNTAAYDRPSWDLNLDIHANIDSKWSIYTCNTFMGSRMVLTDQGDVKLKPTIDLNIGAEYKVNKWLACYLQVNNLMNRMNYICYAYQTTGINGKIGVKWKF